MKMKRESEGAFEAHKDELIRAGIEKIVGEYLVRDGKEHNDGSVGTIRMSPKELRDLLAFMATDVEVPYEPEDLDLSNYVGGA